MTAALYADVDGFRMARPGADAQNSDDPRDFIFDSRTRAYFGLFMSGVVDVAVAPLSGNYYYDIMYGKTFVAPPPALCLWQSPEYAAGQLTTSFLQEEGQAYVYCSYYSLFDRLRISYGSYANASYPYFPIFSYVYYFIGMS
ncbi:MAG: hypothetical protein ACLPSW_01530 [Roseiarcus sp.]